MTVKTKILLAALLALLPLSFAGAIGWRKDGNEINALNRHLCGKVLDYTANHGCDNRIFARSMWQRRDLYVYLPPNYDATRRYPLVIFLHGFAADEQMFLKVAPKVDDAIARGVLPPVIIAAPDGSIKGEPSLHQPASFFINSMAGDFENFVLNDIWDFMHSHFPIRTERQAHILAGVSMGGGAAFDLGIRNRDSFGVVAGVFPPLNLRWID